MHGVYTATSILVKMNHTAKSFKFSLTILMHFGDERCIVRLPVFDHSVLVFCTFTSNKWPLHYWILINILLRKFYHLRDAIFSTKNHFKTVINSNNNNICFKYRLQLLTYIHGWRRGWHTVINEWVAYSDKGGATYSM